MIYDNNSARLLLGCIFNSPQILLTDKYKIEKEDFSPNEYHQRLFQASLFIAKQGGKVINAIDLYNTISKYDNLVALFDENNTRDFVPTMSQLADNDNVDVYYEAVKKCSIIRAYKEKGFDTSRFESDLTSYNLKDIVDYYDGICVGIKKEFYKDKNVSELHAGDGFETIKEQFKQEPMFGATLWSDYLNTAARGWIDGQLVLAACPSGTGKSTIGLANLVRVCCPRIYSSEFGAFIDNPCYQGKGGLYIEFEMKADTEVTPRLISTIADVECWKILNGKYDAEEEARIDEAIKILHESNIHIVVMPDFTVGLIEAYIRDYVLNRQVKYIVYDYITEGASASSDIARKNGVATRSDQVLSAISAKLKEIAVTYNVAVLTFMQVNMNINTQEILDAGCLAGSRAVQNVLDVGMIINPLRKQERDICDMMMQKVGIDEDHRPNRIVHCFKTRFGSEAQGIKVWIHLDLSTGKVTDCWTTDKFNTPYPMMKTKLIAKK